MPKVTVIVPVYNVEKYVAKCLDSLLAQTLDEIEIIVVNDGATDGSKEILLEYANKYPEKIKYLEKENGGLSDSRNYGVPYAKGEYIAFLDSDDYIEPEMYEKLYAKAKQEDSDMVECDFYWEYPNKQKLDTKESYQGKKEMLVKARVVAWNKLWKTELIQKAKVLFPKGYRYEDVEFFYQMIPFIEKVSFVKEPFIHYVQREGSISNSQNERTAEIFEVLEHVISYYKERGIYEEYQTQLEYVYARFLLCSSFLRITKIKDKRLRKKLINETWERLQKNFPNWKQNTILRTQKSGKNFYMKTVNSFTTKLYGIVFHWIGNRE